MEHASYFNEFLRDEVNLSAPKLDKLDARVGAVYDAIVNDETLADVITGKVPTGSWAHRMIVKPKPDGEYDADVLVEMVEVVGWEPKDYSNSLYNALHNHPTYSKQGHGRKCRCVYLKYAPEGNVACHLDLVPFVTLADGRRVIVNRDKNEWEPGFGSTDPTAFADWVKRRDELTAGHFRRVVRLMKYLRNERGSFNGVRSVILTTVLGLQITEAAAFNSTDYRNLPTALLTIVEDLNAWLQDRPNRPQPLANPSNDGTNFDHRWTDETYENFRDRIHSIALSMRAAYDEPDKAKSITAWKELFGGSFDPPPPVKQVAAASTSSAATTASRSARHGRAG